MISLWKTNKRYDCGTGESPINSTVSSYLFLQVPPRQHQPRPHHHPDPRHLENELDLANKPADIKSSDWESEHGYKHLPSEKKTDEFWILVTIK